MFEADGRDVPPGAGPLPARLGRGSMEPVFPFDDVGLTVRRRQARRLLAVPPSRGAGPRVRGQLRSLLTAARLVRGVTAGTVLRRDGRTQPLPGIDGDPLLTAGSPVLAVAHVRIAAGQVYSSFLWPRGGWHAPGDLSRVTILAAPEDAPVRVTGVVLLSGSPDLHGLTPRELEVLGLVVDGCSNQEIARTLVVAPRTAATHVEHVLLKLGTPTRTHAAVRAEREGLYVPAVSRAGSGDPVCTQGPEHLARR